MLSAFQTAADQGPVGQVVGLGELRTGQGVDARLTTFALGSCLAVALYDPETQTGGLLHAFLPNGLDDRHRIRVQKQPTLFVNPGIGELHQRVVELSAAEPARLIAKIAGGASLMGHTGAISDIGRANIEMARVLLRALGIRLVAEDVGGHRVRTVVFDLANGHVQIYAHGEGEVTL